MSSLEQRVPFRGGGFAPRALPLLGVVGFAAIGALWYVASNRGWVSPLLMPGPGEVYGALRDMAVSGEMQKHLAASLARFFGGFALGATAGIVVGLSLGLASIARAIGVPLIAALFPIPKIALLPLFILWFGIGEASKVATIAFGTFFPVAVATYTGVDGVDRSLIRMAQSFGTRGWRIVRDVVFPAALPGILSGLRIASSIGIVLLVAAEMIGARKGLGAFVLAAGNLMRSDQLIAGVILLSLLGLFVSFVIARIEKYLLRWR